VPLSQGSPHKEITPEKAIKWLQDASKYFEKRAMSDEDSTYWANLNNAMTCRRIADLIQKMAMQR
jgi:hypothetical protein